MLEVYPVWFLVYGTAVFLMWYFKLKMSRAMLCLIIAFLIKDIVVDYFLVNVSRPRVYWAEHAPLVFWIIVLRVLGISGVTSCRGYVGRYTALLAVLALLADVFKDLVEDPSVYGR